MTNRGNGLGNGFGNPGQHGDLGVSGAVDPMRGARPQPNDLARRVDDRYASGAPTEPPYGPAPWASREHGGFSNYAGGGDRDSARYGAPGPPVDPRDRLRYLPPSDAGARGWPIARSVGRMDPWAGQGAHGTDLGLGEPAHRGPHYGKGPKGYKRSDARIFEEVCETIARQGYIDASDVEVSVEAGVVRLVGTVVVRPDKRGLEQLVEEVHGVEEVQNELRLHRGKDPGGE